MSCFLDFILPPRKSGLVSFVVKWFGTSWFCLWLNANWKLIHILLYIGEIILNLNVSLYFVSSSTMKILNIMVIWWISPHSYTSTWRYGTDNWTSIYFIVYIIVAWVFDHNNFFFFIECEVMLYRSS